MVDEKKAQKQLFGTNGVRGVSGKDMTPDLVLHIGEALGSMRKGTIAVGRDTRTSGEALASAVKAGLMATGCNVVDVGILPTPALQYIVKLGFDGGAMITASHNPPEYNGVKIIEADGTEMGDEEVVKLEQRLFDRDFTLAPWDRVGSEEAAPHLLGQYIDAIVAQFPAGIGEGITVAVDPGSGPATRTTPAILERLGCRVFTINATLDGTFPGRLPEPTPEGLAPLADLVLSTGAAFGVAHDGDADRAVFIDNRGRYIEENHEFALVARQVCSERKGIVVTPVSSSLLIEDVAAEQGCSVLYTPVGSVYVARKMIELIAGGKAVAFGGEGNGGLIYPNFQFCRDGGMTAATMVAILGTVKRSLSDLVDDLPPYITIKNKIRTRNIPGLLAAVEEHFRNETIDRTDGLRISRGKTWALVRASGTEPLVRATIESDNREAAEAFNSEILGVTARFTA